MRTLFIECKSYNTAKKRCPFDAIIAKACDGFLCFESVDDYSTWKNQK